MLHKLEYLWDMNINHTHTTNVERCNLQNYYYIVVPTGMHLTKNLAYLLYKLQIPKSALRTLTDHSSIIASSTAASVNEVVMRAAE